jgi:hypothetical protein
MQILSFDTPSMTSLVRVSGLGDREGRCLIIGLVGHAQNSMSQRRNGGNRQSSEMAQKVVRRRGKS